MWARSCSGTGCTPSLAIELIGTAPVAVANDSAAGRDYLPFSKSDVSDVPPDAVFRL